MILRLATGLTDFFAYFGRAQEGHAWLTAALDGSVEGSDPLGRASALIGLTRGGGLARFATHLPLLDQAIGLLESTDSPEKSLTAMAYAFRSVGRAWSGLRADALSDLSAATAAAQAGSSPWVDANVRQLGMAIDSTDATSPDATDGLIEVAETFTALGDAHAAVVTLRFALGLSRVRANGGVQELQRRLLACAEGDASPVTGPLMAQEVARTTAEQGGNLQLTTELADALAVLERSGNHRTAAVIRRDIGLAMLDRDERAVAELTLRGASARLGHSTRDRPPGPPPGWRACIPAPRWLPNWRGWRGPARSRVRACRPRPRPGSG